jgi:hypothetical protein
MLVAAQWAHASPRSDEILWALGFVEGTRQLKEVCESRYPQYRDQNHAAFLASPYAQATGEELIAQLPDEEQRSKLQQALPAVRAGQARKFQSMKPDSLEQMCEKFPEVLEMFQKGMR